MATTSIFDTSNEEQRTTATKTIRDQSLLLDCRPCRTAQSMSARVIYRFPAILRVIGLLFIIPSILGILVAGFSLVSSFATSASMVNSAKGQDMAGVAGLGFLMGFGVSVAIAIWSLLAGTIGWIFWMSRKVWKCGRCGHFIDRD